jgi:hypothetical protein
MTVKLSHKEMRLHLVSAAILLIGLGSAVAIFLAADEAPEAEQGYEVAGKFIYPAMNERSKRYQHDLEMYGGKAAVLADDFNRWFDGLWRGRALAFTVAVLSALTAIGFFIAARNAHPDLHADVRQEKDST